MYLIPGITNLLPLNIMKCNYNHKNNTELFEINYLKMEIEYELYSLPLQHFNC